MFPGLAGGAGAAMLRPLLGDLGALGHEGGAGSRCGRGVRRVNVESGGQWLIAGRRARLAVVGWRVAGRQPGPVERVGAAEVGELPPRLALVGRLTGRRPPLGLLGWPRRQPARTAYGGTADLPGHPVPNSAIASRSDGIAAGPASVNPDNATRRTASENIWVHASHTGLGLNPAALYAVADRLAQARGRWQAFDPPAALQCWYDTPPARPVG